VLYVLAIGWVVQIVTTITIVIISHKSLPFIPVLASSCIQEPPPFSRRALLGVGAPLSWWMTKRPEMETLFDRGSPTFTFSNSSAKLPIPPTPPFT
jgi:hypothetical protein